MRVTTQMAYRSVMKHINNNYSNMMNKNTQLSTGKKYESPSDDPYSSNTAMLHKSELSSLKQYMENGETARNLLADTESALQDVDTRIQDIKALVVRSSTGTMGEDERKANAEELKQIKDHIMSVLNTTNAGRYIFGGYNTSETPITIGNNGENLYNGKDLTNTANVNFDTMQSQKLGIKIGTGITIQATITALDVIGTGDDNLFGTIDEMVNLLEGSFDNEKMDNLHGKMDDHFNRVLNQLASIGGKQKRLDMVYSRSEERELGIEDLISKTEDIDIEEAVMQYKMAEQAYNATLSSSTKIIQPSLLDYLK